MIDMFLELGKILTLAFSQTLSKQCLSNSSWLLKRARTMCLVGHRCAFKGDNWCVCVCFSGFCIWMWVVWAFVILMFFFFFFFFSSLLLVVIDMTFKSNYCYRMYMQDALRKREGEELLDRSQWMGGINYVSITLNCSNCFINTISTLSEIQSN